MDKYDRHRGGDRYRNSGEEDRHHESGNRRGFQSPRFPDNGLLNQHRQENYRQSDGGSGRRNSSPHNYRSGGGGSRREHHRGFDSPLRYPMGDEGVGFRSMGSDAVDVGKRFPPRESVSRGDFRPMGSGDFDGGERFPLRDGVGRGDFRPIGNGDFDGGERFPPRDDAGRGDFRKMGSNGGGEMNGDGRFVSMNDAGRGDFRPMGSGNSDIKGDGRFPTRDGAGIGDFRQMVSGGGERFPPRDDVPRGDFRPMGSDSGDMEGRGRFPPRDSVSRGDFRSMTSGSAEIDGGRRFPSRDTVDRGDSRFSNDNGGGRLPPRDVAGGVEFRPMDGGGFQPMTGRDDAGVFRSPRVDGDGSRFQTMGGGHGDVRPIAGAGFQPMSSSGVNGVGFRPMSGVSDGGFRPMGGVSDGGFRPMSGVSDGGFRPMSGVSDGGFRPMGVGAEAGGFRPMGDAVNSGGFRPVGGSVDARGFRPTGDAVNPGAFRSVGGGVDTIGFTPIGDAVNPGGIRPMSGGVQNEAFGSENHQIPHSLPLAGQKRGYPFSAPEKSPDKLGGASGVKLFVGSVPRTATEEDIRPLFDKHGHVLEVATIKDRKTLQPQGCCFIKYASSEDADRAIKGLHNQYTLPGGLGPIQVRYADGERERIGAIEYKLFVAALNKHATEKDVEEIFSPYGRVIDVFLMRDELKQSRGCGFVKYPQQEMAQAAINALNGIYTMRGCEHPLSVKYAEAKRPKPGELRGALSFGGPTFGPRLTAPGIRPSSDISEPFPGFAPPDSWPAVSTKNLGAPHVGIHSFTNQLPATPGGIHIPSNAGPRGNTPGNFDASYGPSAAPAPSIQNFNQSQHNFTPLSSKPIQSPSPLRPPNPESFSNMQSMRAPQHGQMQTQFQNPYNQAPPSQQFPGLNGPLPVPQNQLQHNVLSGQGQAPASANQQQHPVQPLHQSPSQLAQMLTQQKQTLQATFQSSQQTFNQLQQQLQQLQPSSQNLTAHQPQVQPSSQNLTSQQGPQATKQQSTWPGVASEPVTGTPGILSAANVAPTPASSTMTCNWSEHTSPDGYKYYYNGVTGESKWEKPEEMKVYEQQQQQQKPVNQVPQVELQGTVTQHTPQIQVQPQGPVTQHTPQMQVQPQGPVTEHTPQMQVQPQGPVTQHNPQMQVQPQGQHQVLPQNQNRPLQQGSQSSMFRPPGTQINQGFKPQEVGYGQIPAVTGPVNNDPTRYPQNTDPAQYPQNNDQVRYPRNNDPARYPPSNDPTRFQQNNDPARFQQQNDPARLPQNNHPARYPQASQQWMWQNKPSGT